ncbi:MAG: hypothetical protein QGG40_08415, partial [Myxococcota bacterium]|nr:hypothetical protein [Myxococcota bacterium]
AADTTNARYTTLAPIDHEGAFQPRNGVRFSIEDGPEVELPSDAYVDSDGNPYDGEISFEATHYDVAYKSGQYMTEESGSERAAAPGDYSAVDTEGEDQLLESFGMFQLDLFGEDGEELELDGETSAQFTMPLSDSSTTIGETIPAWHYDTEAMTWVEEGEGEVVELADGTVAWQFEAPHFSTWNADQPIRTWGCVTCPDGIRDFDGRPLKGVQTQVDGVDFNSSTADSSDDDGGFCIVTKNDSTVDFSMTYAIGGTAYQETERLILPPGQATCDEISACVRPESCTLDIPL